MKIYKVNYVLDPRKALKFKGENSKTLPEWLYDSVGESFKCERILKLETSFNVLSIIVVSDDEVTDDNMQGLIDSFSEKADIGKVHIEVKSITSDEAMAYSSLADEDKAILREMFGVSECKATMTDKPETGKKIEKIQEGKTSRDEKGTDDSVFDEVERLIAVEQLKLWAKEMKAVKDKNLDEEMLRRSLMCMSYLVSVNKGNGSSTIFEFIGKVLSNVLGKKGASLKEYVVDPDSESKDYNVPKILSETAYSDGNGDTLYVFAIWIDNFQNNKFVSEWFKLLSQLRAKQRNAVFIFAVPYLEKSAVNDLHERIEDIMPNRVISVKPMSNDDYVKCFARYFEKCKMTISEDVYPLIPKIIAEEKSDGRFYGINTIKKICDEVSYNKMMNITNNICKDEDCITVEDVRPLIEAKDDTDGDALTGMQKLDAMISLDEVKKRIREIIASVKMQRKINGGASSSMHMMFSGAPGTGKTVVARILGEILREENILSAGGFYEVSRKDLVGSYVGHTAPKTAEACKLAYGSILFIDEAYMLDGGGENDFGKEAIGTLIAEMENKRGDMVVIFAGYEKELEKLFALNPGLRDRIPYRIHFDNYNREELKQIFYKMLPGKFTYGAEFDEAVKDFFDNLSDEIMESPNFSNGRFVRNLVERVMSKMALRMQMEGEDMSSLEIKAADFRAAIADGEFNSLNLAKKAKKIGFGF